jgi:hypothetical protein
VSRAEALASAFADATSKPANGWLRALAARLPNARVRDVARAAGPAEPRVVSALCWFFKSTQGRSDSDESQSGEKPR